MDEKGTLTTDIIITLVILVLIFGITSTFITLFNEKTITSISSENIEKIAGETCDNLINNPGFPKTWNELDNPYNITPGLAIVDENNKTISNSVSYFKLIKLNEYYHNLIDYKVFNNTIKSSMTLEPIETTISSVTIGDEISSGNIYSVERIVICDFFSKYVLKDFRNNEKCNQNHGENYCCDYFKIYSNWLESYDYYLLIDENSYNNILYSIDTTDRINTNYKALTSDKIYLNNILEENMENKSSGIFFIHFKNETINAVIIQIPKDFDENQLTYDYFQKTKCNFKFKVSY